MHCPIPGPTGPATYSCSITQSGLPLHSYRAIRSRPLEVLDLRLITMKHYIPVCLYALLAFILSPAGPARLDAQTPVYGTAQAAVRVIGQPSYTEIRPGSENFQLGSPTNAIIVGK